MVFDRVIPADCPPRYIKIRLSVVQKASLGSNHKLLTEFGKLLSICLKMIFLIPKLFFIGLLLSFGPESAGPHNLRPSGVSRAGLPFLLKGR